MSAYFAFSPPRAVAVVAAVGFEVTMTLPSFFFDVATLMETLMLRAFDAVD